jgi:chromosome segregation protein
MLLELEAARSGEVELRIQLETSRERVRAEVARAEGLARQLVAERAAAEEHARRTILRQRQVASAQSVVAALPAVLDAVDRSVSEARVALAARESERSQQNEELIGLRTSENSLRDRLNHLGDIVRDVEMQIYEKKLQLSTLLERAGEELGLVEDVLVAEYGPEVLVPADDDLVRWSSSEDSGRSSSTDGGWSSSEDGGWSSSERGTSTDGGWSSSERGTSTRIETPAANEDLPEEDTAGERDVDPAESTGVPYVRAEQEARLARADRKLGQLGRVNPLALEEFAALEQRHKFLTEQLTDLTNTRKDLLTIIEEIDEKMQDIFGSAFEDTRAAFNQVFPILFPGGTGSIHLTDPENMLTTGIEVTVKPAGKKIERLSLLSGGERSLAAVALLIAIFKARPSPFYIMDEVEAALDDANLGRLLTIFEDLRQTSQLIVITHQKRTMEIADALYGVSMRADGISAVVGQRVARQSVAS